MDSLRNSVFVVILRSLTFDLRLWYLSTVWDIVEILPTAFFSEHKSEKQYFIKSFNLFLFNSRCSQRAIEITKRFKLRFLFLVVRSLYAWGRASPAKWRTWTQFNWPQRIFKLFPRKLPQCSLVIFQGMFWFLFEGGFCQDLESTQVCVSRSDLDWLW